MAQIDPEGLMRYMEVSGITTGKTSVGIGRGAGVDGSGCFLLGRKTFRWRAAPRRIRFFSLIGMLGWSWRSFRQCLVLGFSALVSSVEVASDGPGGGSAAGRVGEMAGVSSARGLLLRSLSSASHTDGYCTVGLGSSDTSWWSL